MLCNPSHGYENVIPFPLHSSGALLLYFTHPQDIQYLSFSQQLSDFWFFFFIYKPEHLLEWQCSLVIVEQEIESGTSAIQSQSYAGTRELGLQ